MEAVSWNLRGNSGVCKENLPGRDKRTPNSENPIGTIIPKTIVKAVNVPGTGKDIGEDRKNRIEVYKDAGLPTDPITAFSNLIGTTGIDIIFR